MYSSNGGPNRTSVLLAGIVAAVLLATVAGVAPPRAAATQSLTAAQPLAAAPDPAFSTSLQFPFAPRLVAPGASGNGLGYRPSSLALATVAPSRTALSAWARPRSSYPVRLDLRHLGRLTAVRNQGLLGTCWAFATLATIESRLMPGEVNNLSEDNLARQSGFDFAAYSGGGNDQMAAAYLLRWAGPVDESSDPYGDARTPTGLTATHHVQSWIRLPQPASPTDLDIIKGALMQYGALYAAMNYEDGSYRTGTRSYYYGGVSGANHAITIVGWNDKYPRAKFAKRPQGNGAFLCRNSWGRGWGAKGYFWLSYYDSVIGSSISAFPAVEPASNYAHIYQYDPLGETDRLGWSGSETGWFANRFVAGSTESLRAVGFSVPSGDASYTVYAGPSVDQLTEVASGTTAFAGFTTVRLASPVALTQGSPFVVAVRQTTPGYYYPVPTESPIAGYTSRATASQEQSFVSADGTRWVDLAGVSGFSGTSVCVKAYTN